MQQVSIADFGEQWTQYTENDGYYVSLELFKDNCGPLLTTGDIADAGIRDIRLYHRHGYSGTMIGKKPAE